MAETTPDLYVDDLYFSAAMSDDQNDPQNTTQQDDFQVSDSMYAEELQFQEALMASIISATQSTNPPIPTSQIIIQANITPQSPPPLVIIANTPGESSLGFCGICYERKEKDLMFKFETCVHSYCIECVSKHVATRVLDDGSKTVTCPDVDCKTVLGIDSCKTILPKRVADVWEKRVLVDESEKFYCPYKDCSGMLVNESRDVVVVESSECPYCHRLFCARCYVPWHSGVSCEEFLRLNEDERSCEDLMVREIAKKNKWGRCPQCKFYVERIEGCPHITCRCNFQFCYGCGASWSSEHGGCQRN